MVGCSKSWKLVGSGIYIMCRSVRELCVFVCRPHVCLSSLSVHVQRPKAFGECQYLSCTLYIYLTWEIFKRTFLGENIQGINLRKSFFMYSQWVHVVYVCMMYVCICVCVQLFYLVASSYQVHCKTLEMLRQRGADIYWSFFTDQAPLHLPVDEGIKTRISQFVLVLV